MASGHFYRKLFDSVVYLVFDAMRVKIFYGLPSEVERELNMWIRDARPTVLLEEAKKLKSPHVVHAHCVGLGNKLCIIVFYEAPEELLEGVND